MFIIKFLISVVLSPEMLSVESFHLIWHLVSSADIIDCLFPVFDYSVARLSALIVYLSVPVPVSDCQSPPASGLPYTLLYSDP